MGNSCQKTMDEEDRRTLIVEANSPEKDKNNLVTLENLPFAPVKMGDNMADYEEVIIRVRAKSSDIKFMRDNNCINRIKIESDCLKEDVGKKDVGEEGFSNYQKVNSCGCNGKCNGKCNKRFNKKLKLLLLLFIVIFLMCELRM